LRLIAPGTASGLGSSVSWISGVVGDGAEATEEDEDEEDDGPEPTKRRVSFVRRGRKMPG